MHRPNLAVLTGFVVVLIALLAGLSFAKGGIYLGKHEGDTLHLLQILFRMEMGQTPHLDFMTPIGILAFAPIVAFLKMGFGVAQAFLGAQLLMAVCLAPAAIWTARSRLTPLNGLLFVTFIVVFCLALVHGEAQTSISISMHYNRWAWALAFLVITLAALPARGRPRPWLDSIVIACAMVGLALLKVTYFACFAPPVIIALLMRKEGRTLSMALGLGLLICAVFTGVVGLAFWDGYVSDLLAVSASETRPQPGLTLSKVMGDPQYMGATFAGLLAVIFMRQSKLETPGLLLLLLLPGFFYVTYQNFGNDPQWLWLLAILIFAQLPSEGVVNGFGWDMRRACQMVGVAVLAFGMPSFLNLAFSPMRHFAEDKSEFVALLPRSERHQMIQTNDVRAQRVDGLIAQDLPGSGLEAYAPLAKREDITEWQGERLPQCEISIGLVAWKDTIARDLEEAGIGGAALFTADLFNAFWLYGDFPSLKGGAPWYYGDLPGVEAAEYLVVPQCAISPKVRKEILGNMGAAKIPVTEVRRTPLYILYKIGPSDA